MAEPRPLRADARRNRARLLQVAERLFAERGTDVSTEAIAREAGVGVGTLFRHFPTKEALLEAVFLARMEASAQVAERLADSPDPGGAFVEFFTMMVERSATKNVLSAALAEAGIDPKSVTAGIRDEFRDRFGTLLRRAQVAGAVRSDIGLDEVIALLLGLAAVGEEPMVGSAVAARSLQVVLAGMRAS